MGKEEKERETRKWERSERLGMERDREGKERKLLFDLGLRSFPFNILGNLPPTVLNSP